MSCQLILPSILFLDSCLCRRESGYRHPEWGAAHVVETYTVAKFHRRRLAAMLSAYTAFEIFAYGASFVYRHLHQLSHAILVEHLEWVHVQNLLFQIRGQEAGNVVTTIAEGHLRKVVGAKAKVLGFLRYLVGRESGARHAAPLSSSPP